MTALLPLKQVLADSGVSLQIAEAMQSWHIPVLVLGWLAAAKGLCGTGYHCRYHSSGCDSAA